MSTETLKFFEDKNTESIINWMINNLTEQQIRMCLDQSGIPDTSIISESPMETAAAAAGSVIGPTMTLPDGTVKQLQPGEGSSSEPLPQTAQAIVEEVKKTSGRENLAAMMIRRLRTKCADTPYIIKSANATEIIYYQFKEIEEADIETNPSLNLGDVKWVLVTKKPSEFRTYCTPQDKETLEILKDIASEEFNNPPEDLKNVIEDYVANGYPAPIVLKKAPIETITQSEWEGGFEPTPVPDQAILKMLTFQKDKSYEILSTRYPILFRKGLNMFPAYAYGSKIEDNENNVKILHVSIVVEDGSLKTIYEETSRAVISSKLIKIVKNIQAAIDAGLYVPSDNIIDEISAELVKLPENIRMNIKTFYDPDILSNYTFFGTTEDEDFEIVTMPTSPDLITFDETPELSPPILKNESSSSEVKKSSRNRRVADLSIEELTERMEKMYGADFARRHKPVKYTTKIGTESVKYVKKECKEYEDEPFEAIKSPIFSEFQGLPSVNEGPGRFGETEELTLF